MSDKPSGITKRWLFDVWAWGLKGLVVNYCSYYQKASPSNLRCPLRQPSGLTAALPGQGCIFHKREGRARNNLRWFSYSNVFKHNWNDTSIIIVPLWKWFERYRMITPSDTFWDEMVANPFWPLVSCPCFWMHFCKWCKRRVANAIAEAVGTRSIKVNHAIIMGVVCNFVGLVAMCLISTAAGITILHGWLWQYNYEALLLPWLHGCVGIVIGAVGAGSVVFHLWVTRPYRRSHRQHLPFMVILVQS